MSKLKAANREDAPSGRLAATVLEQQIGALPGTLSRDALMTEAKALCKAHLAEARQKAEQFLSAGGSGLACAEKLSHAQDAVIRALYDLVLTHIYPAANRSAGERIAVCATGGYGRGTMAPGSDVDVLFLMPLKSGAWTESVAEAILYPLWDLGLKVGHATRTTDECIRESAGDLTIRTALLEARLVTGDLGLFRDLKARFDKEVVQGSAAEYARGKLDERDMRLRKQGTSRYLVEPNIKEGKGGLRDLNTLFWISKYVYRVQDTSELVREGVFTTAEATLFRRCEDFLWRVRCMMHFIAGRAEERLSFDMQRMVTERFGYRERGGLSPVERFMKRYFQVAKDVGDLTAIVSASLEAREQKPRAMLDRMFGTLRRRRRSISGTLDFLVDHDRITATSDTVFTDHPINLIRLFGLAAQYQLELHPDVKRLVTLSLRLINDDLRQSPEANRLFLDILCNRSVAEEVLRKMHETGVLGRFVPDFGRIQAMMQFSSYHHYTVDEHTLYAIGILGDIALGKLKEELPIANAIYPGLPNPKLLHVALFLHDIGKGRPEDHSIVGARIARELCPRFGLNQAETDTVCWLIEQHLLMSTISQHRDITDPKTLESFAAEVQTMERLKLLLVLTVCDIRAVGPGVWNGWKGQLLRSLYWETEMILTGGHSALNRKERVLAAQQALRVQLPKMSDAEFEAYAQRHYPAYWLKVDERRKLKHADLMIKARAQDATLLTDVETDAFRGVTELTVLALDHPRLLSILTGACAAAGANIVEAQIFTTTDGLALDTIFISRAFDRDEDELRRAGRIAEHIVRTLKGEIRLPDEIASRASQQTQPQAFSVSPQVVIDNQAAEKSTVVEVTGLDRPGLLYDLTTVIGRQNLNIVSARIVTFGEKAVDVFYLTDLTGGKITQTRRQNELRTSLLAVLGKISEKVQAIQ